MIILKLNDFTYFLKLKLAKLFFIGQKKGPVYTYYHHIAFIMHFLASKSNYYALLNFVRRAISNYSCIVLYPQHKAILSEGPIRVTVQGKV